ncbi:Flagellar basal body-associated protein FliL [Monaibacterium marinum]|uniref:Flagellar protein FliL n=1 Tax=Pontivivens marinum TaxID=1690039 RepID=A0A2C9CV11_9RHOB|nr:flagellar basal body-associated FliL family protein [Monaibacterium marinum]SOH95098.1 Flagellar basal body-associated protein FliL [Monaibacterium marinum]
MRFLIILSLAVICGAGGAGAAWVLKSGQGTDAVMEDDEPSHYGFVELQNQFVVPLTDGDTISGLVAVSLAIEGEKGQETMIEDAEPRLRDAFLRVLFDHARADGFSGDFTNNTSMSELRNRLSTTAHGILGSIANGVLITSVTRQDF